MVVARSGLPLFSGRVYSCIKSFVDLVLCSCFPYSYISRFVDLVVCSGFPLLLLVAFAEALCRSCVRDSYDLCRLILISNFVENHKNTKPIF
jgi:hypothetical protein